MRPAPWRPSNSQHAATMREELNKITSENAQAIAIEAFSYVAGDEKLLPRFLAITGIEARDIRAAASEPGFLAGVLQFLAAHEPSLLAFCQATGVKPESVLLAMRALPGGNEEYLRST